MTTTTDTTGRESAWSKPYVRRRIMQAVMLAAVAVATGFGLITAEQADSAEAYIPTIIAGLGGIISSSSALTHLHRGSDSTATGDDVRAAQAATPDLNAIAEAVRHRVGTDLDKRLAEADLGGRHAAKPEPVGGTYPGGEIGE
ncbi:hypothetical protein [Corynebacterium variabile]|uniref:hypothetical protein n=1 Tax=Corynebacterium variabile TaxID=1727 RepID=UPI003FD1A89F